MKSFSNFWLDEKYAGLFSINCLALEIWWWWLKRWTGSRCFTLWRIFLKKNDLEWNFLSALSINHYHAETCVSKTSAVCPPPQALAYARRLPGLHLTWRKIFSDFASLVHILYTVFVRNGLHHWNKHGKIKTIFGSDFFL